MIPNIPGLSITMNPEDRTVTVTLPPKGCDTGTMVEVFDQLQEFNRGVVKRWNQAELAARNPVTASNR